MTHDLPDCYLCHMNRYLAARDILDPLCDQLYCDMKFNGINAEVRGMVK